MLTRDLFANLSNMWLNGPAELTATWDAQAAGRPYTGRNHMMGNNIKLLRGQTSILDFQGSPGNLSGFPILSIAGVQSATLDSIAVTVGLPTLPVDWVITESIAIAFLAVTDPSDDVGQIYVGTGSTPFGSITIAGPDHTLDYVVCGWLKYTRPDAKTAYGPSLLAATSHA